MSKREQMLKGGSLCETVLVREGTKSWIRKSVCLDHNREFGYDRWYSQLKLLQQYSIWFPGFFPRIIRYGVRGRSAYVDLEAFPALETAFDFLIKAESGAADVQWLFDRIMDRLSYLHRYKFASGPGAIELYISEKIVRKLNICMANDEFKKFADRKFIWCNGIRVLSLVRVLSEYTDRLCDYYLEESECSVHGNITLENILFDAESGMIWFIDPYAEGVIGSPLIEYSQLLQSCRSNYEVLNAKTPKISVRDGSVAIEGAGLFGVDSAKSSGLGTFAFLLEKYLAERFSKGQIACIRLFEISQFIRMLPFKLEHSPAHALLFYSLASSLFEEFYGEGL